MKIETTVTLTPDELNKYVADGMKDDGQPLPPGAQLTVVISKESVPSVPPASAQSPSTAPIGQTIDGVHITHYGYPGDSSPDSNSMAGIGDRGNKLTPNMSVAMNKLAREKFFPGVEPSPSTGRQMTALGEPGHYWQDDDTAPETDFPRVDVYDPYYTGIDPGCTRQMYEKSKAQMVAAGILPA